MRSLAQERVAMRAALVAPLFLALSIGCAATPEGDTETESHRASRTMPRAMLPVLAVPATAAETSPATLVAADAPAEGKSASNKRLVAYWASWTAAALPVAKIDWSKV